jgi:hypothetical protein
MKNLIVICIALGLGACASNPNKAENISTNMRHDEVVSGDLHIGIKNGDLVAQRKVVIAEDLRDLQIAVYEMEDHVYGNEKYGNRGIYGVLKDCRKDLSNKANGGDGHLTFIEPIDRVAEQDNELNIGLDERDKLIGVTEEYLKDRISRFRGYKKLLSKRQDDLQQKLDVCDAELKSRQYDVQAANSK